MLHKKILVVDDDPFIREILATQLSRLHYRTAVAADGEEAVSAFKKEKPDLILMDLLMPRLDGLDATQRIRALEKKGARVPILFLTAREGSQNKLSSIISGGDDFVTKPVTFQELAGRVEEALKRAKSRTKKKKSP
ncbi:MAG: response regulator [Elusimicrobia bacterium]|nr:response regulator [Elusimicrobiota bacterium]